MAEAVYILCGLTSIGCAGLLIRNCLRSRARLLFWSGLCFVCLAASNIVLFVDLVMLPSIDLSALRHSITLAGLVMLLYGMIWETK